MDLRFISSSLVGEYGWMNFQGRELKPLRDYFYYLKHQFDYYIREQVACPTIIYPYASAFPNLIICVCNRKCYMFVHFPGQAIGLILCGLVVRLVLSSVVVLGNGFSWLEICFVAIAWLPKATVQVSRHTSHIAIHMQTIMHCSNFQTSQHSKQFSVQLRPR